jgi:hypothetical protein
MAFVPGDDDGTLNGVTAVTIVGSPAASTRRMIRTITIQNRDTAVVTVTLRKVNGANTRQLWKGDLDVGDTLIWDDPLVLNATNKSITAVMSGAAATTNPDWTSTWADDA